MNKAKIVIALSLVCLLFGCFVLADDLVPDADKIDNPLPWGTIGEVINFVINFFFAVGVVVVPLMIIIAAFYLVTSGGDPERVQKGQNIIWYTVLGFLLILLAKGLVSALESVISK